MIFLCSKADFCNLMVMFFIPVYPNRPEIGTVMLLAPFFFEKNHFFGFFQVKLIIHTQKLAPFLFKWFSELLKVIKRTIGHLAPFSCFKKCLKPRKSKMAPYWNVEKIYKITKFIHISRWILSCKLRASQSSHHQQKTEPFNQW